MLKSRTQFIKVLALVVKYKIQNCITLSKSRTLTFTKLMDYILFENNLLSIMTTLINAKRKHGGFKLKNKAKIKSRFIE